MNILFAENSLKEISELNQETIKDLALDEIIDHIARGDGEKRIIRDVFRKIPLDMADVTFRQQILSDLMANEGLTEDLTKILDQIKALKEFETMKMALLHQEDSLYVLLEKLRELSVYVNVSEDIVKCLKKYNVKADGLLKILDHLDKVVSDEWFEQSKTDINKMLEELSNVRSAMVGVNFTADLNIEEVSVVEFLPHRIRSKYKIAEIAASMGNIVNTGSSANSMGAPNVNTRVLDPLLVTMTPQIEKHMKRHYTKIKKVMAKHIRLDSSFVTELYEGLTFYLAMSRFAKRLIAGGCEICMPQLTEQSDSFLMKDLYNVRLFFANEKNIVKNDFSFSRKENLYILTGPNRGGKTIIEQSLGIISIMASIGSFVTASSCVGRPFTKILTHFPVDENLTINYGRLGEEAVRIRELVAKADERTLILFNETYSTTSAADGLYLSMDLLRVLKELGTAAIFNTHIHELAKAIDEMNAWSGESDIISIVMEIVNNVNTFRIKRSEPELKSYARNIAQKYEITYEQMIQNKKAVQSE